MSSHKSIAACLFAAAMLAALSCARQDEDFKAELPRIPATAPADAAKQFKLLDGFRVELVAAEPLVTSPVDMAFDEDGRLWVVEMNDYPFGPQEGNPPQGRVRVLEDKDGDGRMDSTHTVIDKLSWPTGLALWDGGAFVACAPDILYIKDTNGDYAADVRDVVFSGFQTQNVQALINNIKWGLDNWFYGASGPNGGQVRPGNKSTAPAMNVGGRDFRFRPTGEFDLISGGGQFGHSMDDFGRRFVCSNSNHARHVVLENRYLARNPSLAVPAVVHSIPSDGDQAPVYRLSPAEPWRIVRTRLRVAGKVPGPIEHGGKVMGYFTSATGITVYRGTALGDDFYGNLFIGDVASNLVHRKRLTASGVTFVADRMEKEHEFLASPDTWFRPCNFANGPDGALYICDIYREVVEHPASIPEIIKKHLDLTSGKDRGRIWRVTGTNSPPYKKPQLGKASAAELVDALRRRDGWWRETAGRLIYQRQDKSVAPGLRELLKDPRPETRVAALWALDGLGVLTTESIVNSLADSSPDVREQAIRLAEPRAAASSDLRDRLVALADDPNVRVRFQLAYTLGSIDDPRAGTSLARLAIQDGGDIWCRTAILSSLGDAASKDRPSKAQSLLASLTSDPQRVVKTPSEVLAQLVVLVGLRNRPDEVRSAMTFITSGIPTDNEERQWAMLRGLADGRRRAGEQRGPLSVPLDDRSSTVTRRVSELVNRAAAAATDDKSADSRRIAAIGLLAYAPFDLTVQSLPRLLSPRTPQPVLLAAVRTLSAFSDARVAPLLLESWRAYSPPVRREVMEALIARADRVPVLLDALENGVVRRGDIELDRRVQLVQHRDASIQARAKKMLDAVPGDRAKVIAAYQPALNGGATVERGMEVFRKHCKTCHRIAGEGTDVGPDLRTVRERTPEQLLEQILDPNREINPAYINYTLATTDGRILTGLIGGESATSVTLKRAEGATDTILRTSIDEMQSTGLSLMPEGLEKEITPQQMADVITLLRNGGE
jgi:putative membrane-bound dehydrogenase-like protein